MTEYDELPYLSLPIAYTQPDRMAALAMLHGLAAPHVETARVLELGCASGGNLLPLAARWPKASFVGLDISSRQIAEGTARQKHFAISNIELIAADVAQHVVEPRAFDFVICHGLFSWVSSETQSTILARIASALSEDGIAAISFNTLPGWHLRAPVRDLIRDAAGTRGAPRERVARARDALAGMRPLFPDTPYGALMRREAEQLARMPSSYLLGEFLAENRPLHFADFEARARQHGLAFVCEADLDAGARKALSKAARDHIERLADADAVRAGQTLDVISGRPFRRALLTRAARPVSAPSASALTSLHLQSSLTAEETASGARGVFRDRDGARVTARSESMARIIAHLARAYPGSVPVDHLLALGGSVPRDRTLANLLDLVRHGHAIARSVPLLLGAPAATRPEAWAFARSEAALGLPGVSNLLHMTVALDGPIRTLLPYLDGAHDRPALAARLAALKSEQSPADLAADVEAAIAHAARAALLFPGA